MFFPTDQPCREYDRDPEDGRGSTKITKYIEAISGFQYKIHINASPSFELPTGCLAFRVSLDGYRVSGQTLAAALVAQYLKRLQASKLILDGSPSFSVKSSEVSQILRVLAENSLTYFVKRKARIHLTHISQMMVLNVLERSSSKFTTFIIPEKHQWGQALVLRHFQH